MVPENGMARIVRRLSFHGRQVAFALGGVLVQVGVYPVLWRSIKDTLLIFEVPFCF
jgi:hypothetical protein